jgi:peptide/nickel transport system substrate-binding protein
VVATAASFLLAAAGTQAADPTRGGTLNVGVVSDPVTLDPAFMASYFELYEQYLIYEPLLRLSPDLKVATGIASYKQADDLTFEFEIQKGVTFQDGTAYDAAAAKFNLERMLDPKVGSPRRAELGPITSIDVTGPLTFAVHFSKPYPLFPLAMTNRAGLFVSPAALTSMGPDFAAKGVGAGPFKLESWTKNGQMVLSAFDGYYRGRPALDRIVLRPIPDETLRTASLKSGDLQLVDVIPPQMLTQIKGEAALDVTNLPSIGFNAFSINNTKAPFNDKRVRQALLYAIDGDVVNKIAYFNTGSPAYGPISPAISWAYDPSFKPYKRDVGKAKQLLSEAGFAEGAEFTITVVASPIQLRIAQIIQAESQEAGFKVTIRQIDATSLFSVLNKRDFDLCWSPWTGRPDPDGNTFTWFTKAGPYNYSGYTNPVVDDLLMKARVSGKQAERASMYRQVQSVLADDAAVLFLHFDATLQGFNRKLHWTPYPDAALRLSDAWLEK